MTGFGKFFKERTDKDASELESAREVERVVEEVTGEKLVLSENLSSIVAGRGNVFRLVDVDRDGLNADVDARIDKLEAMRRKIRENGKAGP